MTKKLLNGGGFEHPSPQMFSDTPSEKVMAKNMVCEYGTTKFEGGGIGTSMVKIKAKKGNIDFEIIINYVKTNSFISIYKNLKNKKETQTAYLNTKSLKKDLEKYIIKDYEVMS